MSVHRPFLIKSRGGFTLLEMLVATAILIVMVVMMASMFNSLTSTTSNSGEKLEVDVLARQALDRIGRDLSLMASREDLDYFLQKLDGNDQFHFFSRVPGVLPDKTGNSTEPASGVTLVGYRVVNGNLERLSIAQPFNALTFLTYDEDGDLIADTGITKALGAAADTDYHVLSRGVFRFELGFLLKDGSYAPLPLDTRKNLNLASASAPGYREWSPAPHAYARVRVPDGPSSTVFRPLGWQDVAAVVVTLAVIDPANASRLTAGDITTAAGNLTDALASTDPTNLVMPEKTWKTAVETPGALGVSQKAQGAIRVYQRTYHLHFP